MFDVQKIHRAIWRLKAESFLAIDEKRWGDFAQLFITDARIDYSRALPDTDEPLPVMTSVAAYVSLAAQFIGSARTVHQASVPIIDVLAPDHAKALWRMEDIIVRPADAPEASGHGYGLYEDEYRLLDDGWRISSLTFTRLLFLPISPDPCFYRTRVSGAQ